jgi:hypothetical protein
LLIFNLFALSLFGHNADIEIEGENRYKSLRLIPQVYNYSHNKLFDLKIKDRNGETVPYFINSAMSEEIWFIESLTPSFTVESENKRTKIIIDGLKHLRLCDMVIETDSMFIRNFSTPGGVKKELYNLSVNGDLFNDTTLPLGRTVSRDDLYIVTVNDGDDKPITVRGITVRYYADDLVFEGRAGERYTLEFGSDSANSAPVYDIGRYKNEILKGPVDRLSLCEIRFTEAAPEQKIFFNKVVFNIAVILVTLLLGVLIVLKLKK